MATALQTLVGMGKFAPAQAARHLQKRAPAGHKLAYINEREERMLREQGGSGVVDPATGIRRFDDGTEFIGGTIGDNYGQDVGTSTAPLPVGGFTGPTTAAGTYDFNATANPAPAGGGGDTSSPFDFSQTFAAPPAAPAQPPPSAAAGGALNPTGMDFSQGFTDSGTAGGSSQDPYAGAGAAVPNQAQQQPGGGLFKGLDLGKLAAGGLSALLGARAAKNAQAQGQQAKTDTQAIATPYQKQGAQLQAQAQRGELTPGGEQAIQAMRAQLQQGIANRGGVGVAQAENQIASLRQNLLDQQWQLGLKMSGIGDQIAIGAIQTGVQADRYVNQLTSSYYNNLARTLYGALGGNPG